MIEIIENMKNNMIVMKKKGLMNSFLIQPKLVSLKDNMKKDVNEFNETTHRASHQVLQMIKEIQKISIFLQIIRFLI